MMPIAVIDRIGGSQGGIRLADAEHKSSSHERGAEIRGRSGNFAVHEAFTGPPLRATACVSGFNPHGDGKSRAVGAD